ncbi:MAG: hypothetical protein KA757_13185 [Vogesella sp.]|nr:hypothetical protein [Vogesella sp.]
MTLNRRQFIHTGLLGALSLGIAARLAAPHPAPGFAASAADRQLIAALGRGMLGSLPATAPIALVDNTLVAIAGLPLASQAELRQLFDLLQQPLARMALGLRPAWQDASAEQVRAMLDRWRYSRLTLLRSAYQGLHGLLYASWYGDPASWQATSYQLPASMKGYV